jgi:hypothetical protein
MTGAVLVGGVSLPGPAGDVVRDGSRSGGFADTVGSAGCPHDQGRRRGRPGGIVLISPGVYEEAVLVTTPFLTIRGLDRNATILEGGFTLDNGIQVIEADGVAIENLTARHYLLNGFYWSSVFGYRGSYLTAFNNGDYGVFAYDSVYGQFDHSYASGHPDSGFYVGQCFPCHAVVADVLAENNAMDTAGRTPAGTSRS